MADQRRVVDFGVFHPETQPVFSLGAQLNPGWVLDRNAVDLVCQACLIFGRAQ
jgi:hypothetical protein